MIQDLFIIGATGKVGTALVNQIIEKGDINPKLHVNPTRIVGLASSTRTIYSPEGLTEKQAYEFTGKRYDGAMEYAKVGELLGIANHGHNEHNRNQSELVFVDVTAVNEPMTKFHLEIIRNSPHSIVTANKNPVALSGYADFQLLTRDAKRYGYRCSVMAGADAVPFLRDLRDLNDNLHSVQGCLSGTLSYIASELEKGRKFSEILKEAFDKGYTEPHPRDDLNGVDVARKMVVLARAAGFRVGMDDARITPFIPQEYLSENDVSSFIGAAKELDGWFEEKMASAGKKGLTPRYVAEMKIEGNIPHIEVSLKYVPKQSPLGSLSGTMNKIVIISEAYPKGYSVEAQGAGLEVTARNIRRDLLYLLKERKNLV